MTQVEGLTCTPGHPRPAAFYRRGAEDQASMSGSEPFSDISARPAYVAD